MENNRQEFQVTWNHIGQERNVSPSLQARIARVIIRVAGHFPITVECLLHNGIQGVHDNIITIETHSGMKVLVIEDEFVLLFRLADIMPELQGI